MLAYDWRYDWRFEMWVGMWSIGSLSEKEVCKELRKKMIDVYCLHAVSWRGQGSRMLEMEGRGYNLWWCRTVVLNEVHTKPLWSA